MPDMMDWLTRHWATILIFGGGGFSAVASLIVWWRASGEREKRRVGYWPIMILLGAVVSGVGALWAGLDQDRVLDYLSGGDSYGIFVPIPVTGKSVQFLFMQQGTTPFYDVLAEAIDATKRRKLMDEKGLTSENLRSRQSIARLNGSKCSK